MRNHAEDHALAPAPLGPAYPAPVAKTPPLYTIDLDLPPSERWNDVARDYRHLRDGYKRFITQLLPGRLVDPVLDLAARLVDGRHHGFGGPGAAYVEEIKGLARGFNMTVGEVAACQIVYDVTAACTSIVAQDASGRILHGRNLDYSDPPLLRNATISVEFVRGGATVASGVTYAGLIGIFSGGVPGGFTTTIDQRASGSLLENLGMIAAAKDATFLSVALRESLEQETTFDGALARWKSVELIAPVYVIVGGMRAGEGAVVTRDRKRPADVWRLGDGLGASSASPPGAPWFLLETNYDHWKKQPSDDDRRGPGERGMETIGQAEIDLEGIGRVLSTRPVLNGDTTFTLLFSAATLPEMDVKVRYDAEHLPRSGPSHVPKWLRPKSVEVE
jgi:N-acylethanolamine-hydrolysing acid amidase